MQVIQLNLLYFEINKTKQLQNKKKINKNLVSLTASIYFITA